MFFKIIKSIAGSLLFVIGTSSSSLAYAESETYVLSKKVIGTYNKLTGSLGSDNVPWTHIKTSHVAIDDNHAIYVLDRQGKKILVFSTQGTLTKKISIPELDFSDKSEELGDEGYVEYQMEISSDGKYIYLTEGGKENNWALLDNNGRLLKKDISLKSLHRACNNRVRANGDALELDDKLNIIRKLIIKREEQQGHLVDLQDTVYYINLKDESASKVVLTKSTINGKQIFRKEIVDYAKPHGFIGIDVNDSLYIAVASPKGILKVSKEGIVQAHIVFPDEPFFRGWTRCGVLCDGTIYCVPDYSALWNANKSNLIKGEYPIYFFQIKGSRGN